MSRNVKTAAANLSIRSRDTCSDSSVLAEAEVERVQKYSTQVKVPLHY